jgi:hypothetical protein
MDEHHGIRFFAAAFWAGIGPLIYLAVAAVVVWACRKWAPHAEWWFTAPITKVISRLVGLGRKGRQEVLPRDLPPYDR